MRNELLSDVYQMVQAEKTDSPSLRSLFLCWVALEQMLENCHCTGSQTETDKEGIEQLTEKILASQSDIMEVAKSVPAQSHQDLLYKLAFWRWDTSGLNKKLDTIQRSDQMVYSVFQDLLKLTGADDAARDIDKSAGIDIVPIPVRTSAGN